MNIKGCKFNGNSSVELFDDQENILMTFDLQRQKSTSSHEQLVITANLNTTQGNTVLGAITIEPSKILEGLLEFKNYGAVLSRKIYADICKEIENNYMSLKYITVQMPNELTKQKIHEIFLMFCDYISDFEIKAHKNKKGVETYNIPVDDFLDYLKDSDYRDFDSTRIREGLRDNGYTVCNTGRNDNTVVVTVIENKATSKRKNTSESNKNSEDSKPLEVKKAIKVISFKADQVDKATK